MNNKKNNKLITVLTSLLVFFSAPSQAVLTIQETPLFLTAGAPANVMILFDNSGSMNSLVWEKNYNPATIYPSWATKCQNNANGSDPARAFNRQNGSTCTTNGINNSDTELVASDATGYGNTTGTNVFPARTCGTGFILGRKVIINGTNNATRMTKCLKIPTPATSDGQNNRYDVNYLNYLFELIDSTPTTTTNSTCTNGISGITANCLTYAAVDLTVAGSPIPLESRVQTARKVAKTVIQNNPTLKFGLASFNTNTGGKIDANCGTDTATLISKVDAYRGTTSTPLAEAFYEVTRYFRGLSRYNGSGSGNYTSPIEYRCQKNFSIVLTDGYPTLDTTFPTNDPDGGTDLPNWDKLAPASAQADFPNLPQYSDGFKPAGSESLEGYSLFLDDLAKFAYDIDMKKTGNDVTGNSYNDPLFVKQNLETYTIGFSVKNQMLQDAAAYSSAQYYTANDEAQLSQSLQDAVSDILSKTSSASSVASNSTRLSTNTQIYQAKFSSGDWSGQLTAFKLNNDGTVNATPAWNATAGIPAVASRKIYTYSKTQTKGIEFKVFTALDVAQQTNLNTNAQGIVDTLGSLRLAYIRGDKGNEGGGTTQFRPRIQILGDIINSDPAFAGTQDYGFERIPTEGSSYQTFRNSTAYKNRKQAVYVSSNDGMLHAFDATNGAELFAYVPFASFKRLSLITDKNYNNSNNHRYINDGSPKVVDAYIGGAWKTILVGTTGLGGRGVYALDVTNPESFDATKVLWDFTSDTDGDLGLTYPQPSIARMNNGKWAAIIGNGYNSTSEKAILYILDMADGSVISKFDSKVATNNGMASGTPIDIDGDRVADYIYAGDLKGNLWKIDVTNATASNWKTSFGTVAAPTPFFIACSASPCTTSNRQPITTRSEAVLNLGGNNIIAGGQVVIIGTGRYFVNGDNIVTGSQTQSLYGIYDNNSTAVVDARASLIQQEVISTQKVTYEGEIKNLRVTTNKTLLSTSKGYYFDFPDLGERLSGNSTVRSGKIIVTTLTPNGDTCGFGGTSWLMEFDIFTGSRLNFTPFDINNDKDFNNKDYVSVTIDGKIVKLPATGLQITEGIIKTPSIIAAGDREFKYSSSTSGNVVRTTENAFGTGGRQSWSEKQQ